jgi:hypothetical protein
VRVVKVSIATEPVKGPLTPVVPPVLFDDVLDEELEDELELDDPPVVPLPVVPALDVELPVADKGGV